MAKRAVSRIGKQKEREKDSDSDDGSELDLGVVAGACGLSFRQIAALVALNGMLSGADPGTELDMRLCWSAADELLSYEDE